jgi:hypothetical protein
MSKQEHFLWLVQTAIIANGIYLTSSCRSLDSQPPLLLGERGVNDSR